MPIYEYVCKECGREFELLIRGELTPQCPSCESEKLERLISLPRVQSTSTREKSLRAAKTRDAKQGKERMHDQLSYEKSHDRHG